MSPGYIYQGTQRGEHDPWAPKPKPAPKPDDPQPDKPSEPCGTYPAYRRHIRAGEDPDLPCIEAMRAYNREWRAKHKRTPEQKARKRERDRARNTQPEVKAARLETDRARYARRKGKAA